MYSCLLLIYVLARRVFLNRTCFVLSDFVNSLHAHMVEAGNKGDELAPKGLNAQLLTYDVRDPLEAMVVSGSSY